MAASFLRLVHITLWDAPYLPLGASVVRERQADREKSKFKRDQGIGTGEYDPGNSSEGASRKTIDPRNNPDSPGLELFYSKDTFICGLDGKPKWCSQCCNWKPDRTHHCSSSGRCILRMDHFCPWVGGPIGENNFKFFVQFTGWTALYCLHLLIVMAIYIRKQVLGENENVNRHFCAILALATFFGIFTAGMTGTSIELLMRNLTQVERLGLKNKTHILAVLKPTSAHLQIHSNQTQLTYPEITYPLRIDQPSFARPYVNNTLQSNSDSSTQYIADSGPSPGRMSSDRHTEASKTPVIPTGIHSDSIPTSPAFYGVASDNEKPREIPSERDRQASRTFAILTMAQGENPWDLGSYLLNVQSVMGISVFDWIFPIRRSPCCLHEDPESLFSIGPSVDMLKASVSFIEMRDIRTRRHGKHPIRNPYLNVGAPSDVSGKHRRRRRRKSSKKEHTNASLELQNSPIPMQDLHGNVPRTQTASD